MRPRVELSAAAFALVSLTYPLFAAFAVRAWGPIWVVAGLCVLLALRGLIGLKSAAPAALTIGLVFVAAAIAFVALFDRELSVRLYPAFMNAAMLLAFGQTLLRGPSMIERFARMMEPDLPESGVRYTRNVTWVWCAFFLINGVIAAWTAFYASWELWTLYNGVIAYAAMGALFAIEFVVRGLVRGRAERAR